VFRELSAVLASPHLRPLEQRPDIGAVATADPASKLRLEVRQANVIPPAGGIHDDRVSAAVVAAIDQEQGRGGLPHFTEGDFL
jgi:hypothetical protein